MTAVPTDTLLTDVLDCYLPHCRYLTDFELSTVGGVHHATGTFAIAESCYIADTGHLNAVEVNICYNQMLYALIGTLVCDGAGPVFSGWTLAEFHRRKLSDILIARISTEFRAPIARQSFHGQVLAGRIIQRRLRPDAPPLISMDTSFRFWDGGGTCSGTARIAITGGDDDA
jgi:(3R)-3-[(carboxylmethyl)amino]fatty acid synthase